MRPCRDNAETLLRELPPVLLTSFKFSKKYVVAAAKLHLGFRFSILSGWATLAHLSPSEAISNARSLWIATYGWFKQINVTYCTCRLPSAMSAFRGKPDIHRRHKMSGDRLVAMHAVALIDC
jgi:hypothetical protein